MEKILTLLLLVCGVLAQKEPQPASQFKQGDPRQCIQMWPGTTPMVRFSVLPGIGWDNLENKAKGRVIDYTYSDCQTTDDGRYLIPDHTFTIPEKTSYVDMSADIIDSWEDSSSITSNSINANAGLKSGIDSISGSFSWEHSDIKKKQFEDKATTVRVVLRYHRYKALLQPDAELNPAFKQRLLNIAAFCVLNQTSIAEYEAQLLVRNFGTHVQTSVVAGAGLVKTDFIKRDMISSDTESRTNIRASASIAFANVLTGSSSYGHMTNNSDLKRYINSTTHSYVNAHGGPLLHAMNMSSDDWTDQVDKNLVAMDRTGDPLSFLVTRQTLPELPANLVSEVEKTIRGAILQYYKMNTISGCTQLDSPDYSFSANFDDGSCGTKATNNLTFGGVYQTCDVLGTYYKYNPCDGLHQFNPKTQGYSCPESYTAVKLTTNEKVGKTEYAKECKFCGLFNLFSCCTNKQLTATARFTTYWCAAMGSVGRDSGYLFGGIYSNTHNNPITGTRSCPHAFYPRVFMDHKICVSDDYEMGKAYSAAFGGFISCTMGNPLAIPGILAASSELNSNDSSITPSDDLQDFLAKHNNPSLWPKHCPTSYSQHHVEIINGCEVLYCLKSGVLGSSTLMKIKHPPFTERPNSVLRDTSHVMFSGNTQEWFKNAKQFLSRDQGQRSPSMTWDSMWGKTKAQNTGQYTEEEYEMRPGVAAGIATGVTVFCGLVAVAVFTGCWRYRRGRNISSQGETPHVTGVVNQGMDTSQRASYVTGTDEATVENPADNV